jgi:signal transduction histidine kinase
VTGRPRALHPDIDAVLGRVVQEAVANIAKHAAAQTIRLSLSYRARDVRLTVVDDGRGFVVDPEFRSYGGHWGLLGMKERAIQIGANLTVTSAPGQGTELVLVVPRRVASRARSERPARA